MIRIVLSSWVAAIALSGCTKADSSTQTPPGDAGETPAAGESLSAAECEAAGGTVVGDIGNGAIFKPGYTCPQSGQAPLGRIEADPGGPIAVEGSVCCGS